MSFKNSPHHDAFLAALKEFVTVYPVRIGYTNSEKEAHHNLQKELSLKHKFPVSCWKNYKSAGIKHLRSKGFIVDGKLTINENSDIARKNDKNNGGKETEINVIEKVSVVHKHGMVTRGRKDVKTGGNNDENVKNTKLKLPSQKAKDQPKSKPIRSQSVESVYYFEYEEPQVPYIPPPRPIITIETIYRADDYITPPTSSASTVSLNLGLLSMFNNEDTENNETLARQKSIYAYDMEALPNFGENILGNVENENNDEPPIDPPNPHRPLELLFQNQQYLMEHQQNLMQQNALLMDNNAAFQTKIVDIIKNQKK